MLQNDPLSLPPFHLYVVPDPDQAFRFDVDPESDPAQNYGDPCGSGSVTLQQIAVRREAFPHSIAAAGRHYSERLTAREGEQVCKECVILFTYFSRTVRSHSDPLFF
jgi:hypothetical protein